MSFFLQLMAFFCCLTVYYIPLGFVTLTKYERILSPSVLFVNNGGLRVLSYRVFIDAVSLSLHVGLVE